MSFSIKRTAVAATVAVAALTLAACSSGGDAEPTDTATGDGTEEPMEAADYGDITLQLSWIKILFQKDCIRKTREHVRRTIRRRWWWSC